jgi:3-oxoacyl-[acyl-carrier protein] reductase/meso-butanediol dehydrogenase/(S,S)-butanediol dehydrogenase/diacetyl reductase
MPDLTGGHVAIVTGAGRKRGIGRAIALRLAAGGADVAVAGSPRDPATFPEHERAEGWLGIASVAEEIRALGRKSIAVDCDVTVKGDVEALVARAVAELGGLTILVNNAALPSEAGQASIVSMDDAVWYRTVDVNLNGLYLVTKACAREMIAGGKGGSIVNISSTAGRIGIPDYGAYCATKWGMIGFTQQLALELAPHGIRVNCTCPGSTDTDMMDGTFRRTAEKFGIDPAAPKQGAINRIPLRRQGRPADQAAAVAFLCSDDAAYITGQTLNVDGGLSMD